jgi:predicted permease
MNDASIVFLYVGFFISIGFEVATALFALFLVLPLQRREARITDKLVLLRKQLLTKGILAIIIAIASTIALTIRFFIDGIIYRYIIVTLILLHSVSGFAKTYLDYKIYHKEYKRRTI